MLITEHKFNPELSHTPDLIFVDASFSILFLSQNFSLQIRMQESFSPYQPLNPELQKQQIAAENSQNKKNKPKIKFVPRVEFLSTIYDVDKQANDLQNPICRFMLMCA